MTSIRLVICAGLSLLLAACATGTVVFAPGPDEHPAEATARVPAFRPAPDPLFAEGAPNPQPESAMPTMEHGGHSPAKGDGDAKGAHEGHGSPTSGKAGEDPHAKHGGGETTEKSGEHHGDAEPTSHEQGAPSGDGTAAFDRLVREYLTLVQALAKDDFESATAALEHARSAVEVLSRSAQGDVAMAVKRVVNSLSRDPKAIEDVRKDLKPLSEAMADLVRLAPPTRDAAPQLRKIYCPMADASWLQVDADVANPYFGAKMPRCGRVTETIETRPAPERK